MSIAISAPAVERVEKGETDPKQGNGQTGGLPHSACNSAEMGKSYGLRPRSPSYFPVVLKSSPRPSEASWQENCTSAASI